jgi:hypothetical protein
MGTVVHVAGGGVLSLAIIPMCFFEKRKKTCFVSYGAA